MSIRVQCHASYIFLLRFSKVFVFSFFKLYFFTATTMTLGFIGNRTADHLSQLLISLIRNLSKSFWLVPISSFYQIWTPKWEYRERFRLLTLGTWQIISFFRYTNRKMTKLFFKPCFIKPSIFINVSKVALSHKKEIIDLKKAKDCKKFPFVIRKYSNFLQV